MMICTFGHFVDTFIGGVVTGILIWPLSIYIYIKVKGK